MRKAMVAGNWKMNGSRHEAKMLLESIRQGAEKISTVDIVVLPPYVHLEQTERLLADSSVVWGAQDLYVSPAGAFTGEISGSMLTDYGCRYVLIGHSERRALFHDGLNEVADKFKAALAAKLIPVLCLGETRAERESNQTEQVISEQLESVIKTAKIEAFQQAVIAYEPVWAIGTGLTASPEQAQNVHAFIRQQLNKHHPDIANNMRILYGGSVKADNAAGLFAMPDIDGALVGGASLEAKGFLAICQAAAERMKSPLGA
jgi:triosephosphate isomerase